MSDIASRGYADPDALVSTAWVAEHANDPSIRVVESNEDPLLYSAGHVPGAVEIDWAADLNDPLRRDYLDRDGFAELMSAKGISNDTTVVLYGDRSNWWACYALWIFNLFGHTNAKIMDGGRMKWEAEGRELTRDVPDIESSNYVAPERDDSQIRAFRDQVLEHVELSGKMIDVRSPEEYRGLRLHMPDYPNEGAVRGGHIPGAANVPWATAANEDGTFKDAEELKEIYQTNAGLHDGDDIIVYCRIGERSSHTWFVLTRLLGLDSVRNYDGSWTEWGNSVGVPIAK